MRLPIAFIVFVGCAPLLGAQATVTPRPSPTPASPMPAPRPAEFRLAFLGDMGTGDAYQEAVRDQMLKALPQMVFLLGDNVYDDGRTSRIVPRFDQVYAPLFVRGILFHAALGNHDVLRCDLTAKRPLPPDANAYAWRKQGCDVEDQLGHAPFGYRAGRRYYSIATEASDSPLGEVFVLDSNTLGIASTKLRPDGADTAQVAWLETALAASRATWKIVILHHPPHSPRARAGFFGMGGHDREVRLTNQLEPILRRHGVDAVFAGHNHFYARMTPQNGIRYFVAGGGGRPPYPFLTAPDYVAAGGAFLHFVEVRLTRERFEFWTIDADGHARDSGWFGKGDAKDHPFPKGTLPPARPGLPAGGPP